MKKLVFLLVFILSIIYIFSKEQIFFHPSINLGNRRFDLFFIKNGHFVDFALQTRSKSFETELKILTNSEIDGKIIVIDLDWEREFLDKLYEEWKSRKRKENGKK